MTDSEHPSSPTHCISCGAEVPDHAKFCQACGTKVNLPDSDKAKPSEVDGAWYRGQDKTDKPKSGVLDFGANMAGAVFSALAMLGLITVGFQPELCGVDEPYCVATFVLVLAFVALLLAGVVTAIGAMVWRTDQRKTPKIGSFNAWGWFVGVFVWSSALLFLIFAFALDFAWRVWIPSR